MVAAAALFAMDDGFGSFADAFLSTGDPPTLLARKPSGSVDLARDGREIDLEDGSTGDPLLGHRIGNIRPGRLAGDVNARERDLLRTKVTEQRSSRPAPRVLDRRFVHHRRRTL